MIGQILERDKWNFVFGVHPRCRGLFLYGGWRAARCLTRDSPSGPLDRSRIVVRRYAVKAAVQSADVLEGQVRCQSRICLKDAVVGIQIGILVFHRAPQALDEKVTLTTVLAIHAYIGSDPVFLEQCSEVATGKLPALVGVEDLRYAIVVNGLSEGVQAEIRGQGIERLVAQHLASEAIDDGDQIDEAPAYPDVCDIRCSDLVGADVVLLAQLGRSPIPLHRLERRRIVPPFPSCHALAPFQDIVKTRLSLTILSSYVRPVLY